jgi:hypothetical protein
LQDEIAGSQNGEDRDGRDKKKKKKDKKSGTDGETIEPSGSEQAEGRAPGVPSQVASATEPASADDGGFPTVLIVLLLLGVGGGLGWFLVQRRRGSGEPPTA